MVTSTTGSSHSAYGYTAEYSGDYNELVYLRARFYASGTGRFLTKDLWEGDYNSPLTLNGWNYVTGNPINYTDPSGYVLDPSEPTHRGTIIHAMIEAQYEALYSSRGEVKFNVMIPLGSARGLKKYKINGETFWGKDKETLTNGFADIVDWGVSGLYEIKPYSAAALGQGTVTWYLTAWNNHQEQLGGHRYLFPGMLYPSSPTIVGTDPKDARKWITAESYGEGVILYRTADKPSPLPVPVFVWELDPETGKVVRRSGAKAAQWYPQPDFGPALIGIGLIAEILQGCGPLVFIPVP